MKDNIIFLFPQSSEDANSSQGTFEERYSRISNGGGDIFKKVDAIIHIYEEDIGKTLDFKGRAALFLFLLQKLNADSVTQYKEKTRQKIFALVGGDPDKVAIITELSKETSMCFVDIKAFMKLELDASGWENLRKINECRKNKNQLTQDLIRFGLSIFPYCNRLFSFCNLSYGDLSDKDLTDIDLYHANLDHANLTRSNLFGAELSKANFSYAVLKQATLNDVRARATIFDYADLSETLMRDSSFSGASFLGANLSRAKLVNSDFRDAKFVDSILENTCIDGLCKFED